MPQGQVKGTDPAVVWPVFPHTLGHPRNWNHQLVAPDLLTGFAHRRLACAHTVQHRRRPFTRTFTSFRATSGHDGLVLVWIGIILLQTSSRCSGNWGCLLQVNTTDGLNCWLIPVESHLRINKQWPLSNFLVPVGRRTPVPANVARLHMGDGGAFPRLHGSKWEPTVLASKVSADWRDTFPKLMLALPKLCGTKVWMVNSTPFVFFFSFFFFLHCRLVRDMVGQQLEWACDWEQISLMKETNNQPNKNQQQQHTHTQAKARARQNSQGNLQTKWNQVKHMRPSQPLKCSRPPCSAPPRCPTVKCQPYQNLLLDTQASL